MTKVDGSCPAVETDTWLFLEEGEEVRRDVYHITLSCAHMSRKKWTPTAYTVDVSVTQQPYLYLMNFRMRGSTLYAEPTQTGVMGRLK